MDLLCKECSNNIPPFYFAGYLDPGTGYVFNSVFPIILGFITTFFTASVAFFIRKKNFLIFIIIVILIVTIILMFEKKKNITVSNGTNGRIIILGIDGMDPTILSQAIDKGIMPHIMKLKKEGYYSELQTTTPPQSPVAWASFATGVSPFKHGIYDFIVRNPENYQLDLVWTDSISSAIKAETFWQKNELKKSDTTILFLPNTFPPSKLNGQMISGMGTPDILGTAGRFSYFTSQKINENSRGNQVHIKNVNSQVVTLQGPKYQSFNEKKTTYIPLKIERNPNLKQVVIEFQNQKITLKEGEFSQWVPIEFKIDFLTKVNGIGKFYLKEASPNINLYLSPINFDPLKPIKSISTPKSFSKGLANEYGLFSTLGLPHDTWALEEGIFDNDAFLANADSILEERERIYFGELKKSKSRIFFSYFGITDTISHMYWKSPETIFTYYKKIDELIGKTITELKKNDTLIIMSDHGFAEFNWELNVNSWLQKNNYLTLKEGVSEGKALLDGIDWSRTKAFAIGYNGIYLNTKGREGQGFLEKKDVVNIETKLKADLLTLINPSTNSPVVKRLYSKSELNIKDTDLNSPDIFIGYAKGTRSSWDTAVGATPKNIFSKRVGNWAGDHLFDASEVPGILISNKILNLQHPQITDIVPLIIKLISK